MGNKEFIEAAINAVVLAYREHCIDTGKFPTYPAVTADDLYVVWLNKTLQNNKAMIATSHDGDGLYFEVTNNGDKNELYVDIYKKQQNVCIQYGPEITWEKNGIREILEKISSDDDARFWRLSKNLEGHKDDK